MQCQQLSLIDNMLDHLHAIKGASALAGYTLLSEAAEELESQQSRGEAITYQDLLSLKKLVKTAQESAL